MSEVDLTYRLPGILAVLSLAIAPAMGVEVVEQRFQVSYSLDGQDHVVDDLVVPLLPGNACYNWYLRLAQPGPPVELVERFELPEALADWGTTGTAPDDPTRLERDGKVAVTTVRPESSSEGWVGHGWCVAEGDPLGRHVIDVSADGVALASFQFDVVTPEAYDFPATPLPKLTRRSLKASW